MRRRRGSLLVEVIVAFAVAGGALLAVLTLVHSNLAAARRVAEIADIEGALSDLAVELIDRPLADLRRDAGSTLPLDQILEERAQGLPEIPAAALTAVYHQLAGRLSYQLDEAPGGLAGIAVMRITATFSPDAQVTLTRIFRPRPAEVPL